MFEQIKNRTPKCINASKRSAVLIPLIKINNEYHILFEVRSSSLKRQPGEVCFPGGVMESCDNSSLDTVLRETKEELLIENDNIKIYGALDYYLNINGMRIDAYVGELFNYSFTFNEEVESVFTVPLSYFLENEPQLYDNTIQIVANPNLPHTLNNYPWIQGKMDVPFYFYEDKMIWGLTARLLYHNLKYLKG